MILVCLLGDKTSVMNIPDDADFDMFQQMLGSEFSVTPGQLLITHNGHEVKGVAAATKIVELGFKENDMIMLSKKQPKLTIQDVRLDGKPEDVIALVRENPHLQTQFNNADPELGKLIASGDVQGLSRCIMMRVMQQNKVKFVRDQEMRRIEADPDNEDNQRAMMERIRLENINQNMEMAMENLPEAFGRVIMLYVDLQINDHHVKAFVDSGAQSTIMSVACAERCGLTRLIDTRYAGEARGVGTAKIVGRVHIAQMKIGNTFFPISITILEKDDMDFLFGLDMLKRYRCMIDLAENCLRIDGGRETIPFLSENALPTSARGTLPEELAAQVQAQAQAAMDVETEGVKSEAESASSSSVVPTSLSSSTSASASMSMSVSASSSVAAPPIPTASSPAPAQAPDSSPQHSEESVAQLVGMGFTAQQAQAALTQSDGNVEFATSLLLAQSD